MKLRTLPPVLAAILSLTSCATTPKESATPPASESVAQTDDELQERPSIGTRIRSKKNKGVSTESTVKMSGEEYKRASDAARTDPTGDQIIQSRN